MKNTATISPPAVSIERSAPTGDAHSAPARNGHIGRIVAASIFSGLIGAVILVAGPLAGDQEHVITGAVLLAFAGAWTMLAVLSARWTDQPQTWARVPAAAMAAAGLSILMLAPTGNELGWMWPPALLALVAWMGVHAHRDLHSRTRTWLLYPVFAALVASALGGGYQTFREAADRATLTMPGRRIDVGGHRLHIHCTGSGSPTVVLEPGLGEPSAMMEAWIAPAVATTTRVCVYDRAGRGWSESTGPQDGRQVATDLHTLLQRAGEPGPYVLAGHSVGGLYVLNFADLFPDQVAGVVLLDSTHPEQYTRISSYPAFYQTLRRAAGVMPALSRLGVGRLLYRSAYADLPAANRDQERAFWATPRHSRSLRNEITELRITMTEAQAVSSLGGRPLVVLTAQKDAQAGWMDLQDDLSALSTNSDHRVLANASHAMLTEDRETASQSSDAIEDVVVSVRTSTPVAEK